MTAAAHVVMLNEDGVVQRLRQRGTRLLEDVPPVAGLGGATAFSFIDRLSRAGSVALRRNGAESPGHRRKKHE